MTLVNSGIFYLFRSLMARNLEDIIQLLKNPIFQGMTEEILAEIAGVVREEVKPVGAKIFRQNEEGNDFYIIETGRVRVYKEGERGIEIDLNELGPGDDFGVIALVTDEPRTATVEALEETRLLVLSKEQFDKILEDHPRIYANVAKILRGLLDKDEWDIVNKGVQEYLPPSLSWIDYAVLIGIILGIALVFNYTNPNGLNVLPEFYDSDAFPKISLAKAKEKYDSKEAVFIDARPDNFYNQKHIKGAINLPLPLFDIMYMMSGLDELEMDKEIIIYGRAMSAYYDEDVAKKLDLRGHKNIQIMKSPAGVDYYMKALMYSGWDKAGYPVTREETSDSE